MKDPSKRTKDLLDSYQRSFLEEQLRQYIHVMTSWPESPIESLFMAAAIEMGWYVNIDSADQGYWALRNAIDAHGLNNLDERGEVSRRVMYRGDSECVLFVRPRLAFQDRTITPDFVFFNLVSGDRLAVELDGHDFHERTREQATRDKSRDRALLAAGWPVIRFTGSEVWGDASLCLDECDQIIRAATDRQTRRVTRNERVTNDVGDGE